MRETWYVLEDGNAVDPNECSTDDTGAIVHKDGGRIAMRSSDCPMTRGVDVDDISARAVPAPETTADMKPQAPPAPKPKRGYKTRESKAT